MNILQTNTFRIFSATGLLIIAAFVLFGILRDGYNPWTKLCTRGPAQTEEANQNICAATLSSTDAMKLIAQLPRWSAAQWDQDFSRSEWLEILNTAYSFQNADAGVIETAFHEYMLHWVASHGEEDDEIGEWSKSFVLLRVMFVEARRDSHQESVPERYDGFLCLSKANPSESVIDIIEWQNGLPRLTAFCGGYRGSPYAADKEYQAFLRTREKSQLGESIRKLKAGM